MVNSAVQGPRAPSITGTDLGSGVWATAAVSNRRRMGIWFIGAIIRRSPQRAQRGTEAWEFEAHFVVEKAQEMGA
jgi:hypothetical protein